MPAARRSPSGDAPQAESPQAEPRHGTGESFAELVRIMDRLRSPGGCPWDGEQTHRSLVPYLIEEAHETVEAIETDDMAGLREELGDVLLQVVFHARVAEEHASVPFTIDDVAEEISAKLVRRHPHVFGHVHVDSARDVEENWQRIKADEKGRAHVLDGIPATMPALARAEKVVGRLRRSGAGDLGMHTLESPPSPAAAPASAAQTEDDIARRLLAAVIDAEAAGIDAEGALRRCVRHLENRARGLDTGD